MTSFIIKVKDNLIAAGWKHDGSVKDPKILWDLVCKTIPKNFEQSVPQLFNEFIAAKLDNGTPFRRYNARFHYLADRLAQLDVALPPKAKMFLMWNVIKDRYPELSNYFQNVYDEGKLTWEIVESRIVTKARTEESDPSTFRLAAAVTAVSRIYCDTCYKNHLANWPLCNGCGLHHLGGEARCYRLHPELRPAKVPEFTPLPPGQASKGVIEMNTGL